MSFLLIVILIISGLIIYYILFNSKSNFPNTKTTAQRTNDEEVVLHKSRSFQDIMYSENDIDLLWSVYDEDLEDLEFSLQLNSKQKDDYQYGKKIYEKKFKQLIGSPLKEIVKNLEMEYDLTNYLQKGESINIGNVQFIIMWIGERHREWDLEFYGGQYKGIDKGSVVEFNEEGYINKFRNTICKSLDIITKNDLKEFYQNYTHDWNLLSYRDTRLPEVSNIKREIREIFGKPFKERYYNIETKSWKDFDVNGIFLRVRTKMIDKINPFPHYVWKLIKGDPFDRFYPNIYKYMKWKGSKRVSKLVFNNVCMWEKGEIFRENEPEKEFEEPLWINWNCLGSDFLTMKTKLKKEGKDGLQWLKEEVGGHIKSRVPFYKKFGENSGYFITDDLLQKFKELT